MNFIRKHKRLSLFFFLAAAFLTGFLLAWFSDWFSPSADARFTALSQKIFQQEVVSDTITLHYTLADPEKSGISSYPITLGNVMSEVSSAAETNRSAKAKSSTDADDSSDNTDADDAADTDGSADAADTGGSANAADTDGSVDDTGTDASADDADANRSVNGTDAGGSADAADTDRGFQQALAAISPEELSVKNRLTYDTLRLALASGGMLRKHPYYREMLVPTTGIHAQLPVLLAEYAFRRDQDVSDYLALLRQFDTYFADILRFEQEKAKRHLFMSDTTADRVIRQCEDFLNSGEPNLLVTSFDERINACSFLSPSEKKDCKKANRLLVEQHILPAYQKLSGGLLLLKGTGTNRDGLYYYTDGAAYYADLLREETGVYDDIPDIQERLYKQIAEDYDAMQRLVKQNPALASAAETALPDPASVLTTLQEKITADFPTADHTDFDVKYVSEALQDSLSPAFYLTPPIDSGRPNIIYMNPKTQASKTEWFTTLGHEGFPGHLYQNLYFRSTDPDPLRLLLTNTGYIEGWATYAESYAYTYYSSSPASSLLWHNRSMNLSLLSLLDTGIHYYGWKYEQVARFLANFGITDSTYIQEVYQTLVEDPCNYLKYCLGYIQILDLRTEMQKKLGGQFDLIAFHRQLLTIGPAQFPVIRKYIQADLSS